jgi:hypothetical protein
LLAPRLGFLLTLIDLTLFLNPIRLSHSYRSGRQ